MPGITFDKKGKYWYLRIHKTIIPHFEDNVTTSLVREYMRHKFNLFGKTFFPHNLFFDNREFKPCSIIKTAFSWSYVGKKIQQNQFELAKKEGPIHSCNKCHMLCFRHYITKERKKTDSWICNRCAEKEKK